MCANNLLRVEREVAAAELAIKVHSLASTPEITEGILNTREIIRDGSIPISMLRSALLTGA